MKFPYTEEIIYGLNLGDIVAYSKTKNLEYLKGYSPKSIAYKLYDTESLSQYGWKALRLLDKVLYNNKRAQSQKEIFHKKYGYIINKFSKKRPKAKVTQELLDGIKACLKAKSDLPYYMEFYDNYFCVYDIDSIIDMAYTLDEEYKDMCKTLMVSSVLYHSDKCYSAVNYDEYNRETKVSKNESRKIRRLTIAYIGVKGNNEIWNDDNKVVDYLITHFSRRLRTIKMPLKAGWLSQSTIKHLTKRKIIIAPKIDEERFLSLVKKAQNKLLSPNKEGLKESVNVGECKTTDKIENKEDLISKGEKNFIDSSVKGCTGTVVHNTTNIEVLDTPITEPADEIELNITKSSDFANTRRVKSEIIRVKGDIDYSEQQRISQKIGDRGEELVLRNEIEKLKTWGFSDDVLSKVRRVSLESDDYGYDILTFDKDGREVYLEVKTTKVNRTDFSFIITRNELEHAKIFGDHYSIVIVYDVLNNPRMWYMGNPFVEEPSKIKITPTQYRVDVCTDK